VAVHGAMTGDRGTARHGKRPRDLCSSSWNRGRVGGLGGVTVRWGMTREEKKRPGEALS
jgi:hypothetical protein